MNDDVDPVWIHALTQVEITNMPDNGDPKLACGKRDGRADAAKSPNRANIKCFVLQKGTSLL